MLVVAANCLAWVVIVTMGVPIFVQRAFESGFLAGFGAVVAGTLVATVATYFLAVDSLERLG